MFYVMECKTIRFGRTPSWKVGEKTIIINYGDSHNVILIRQIKPEAHGFRLSYCFCWGGTCFRFHLYSVIYVPCCLFHYKRSWGTILLNITQFISSAKVHENFFEMILPGNKFVHFRWFVPVWRPEDMEIGFETFYSKSPVIKNFFFFSSKTSCLGFCCWLSILKWKSLWNP